MPYYRCRQTPKYRRKRRDRLSRAEDATHPRASPSAKRNDPIDRPWFPRCARRVQLVPFEGSNLLDGVLFDAAPFTSQSVRENALSEPLVCCAESVLGFAITFQPRSPRRKAGVQETRKGPRRRSARGRTLPRTRTVGRTFRDADPRTSTSNAYARCGPRFARPTSSAARSADGTKRPAGTHAAKGPRSRTDSIPRTGSCPRAGT